ncbi:MAG: ATP-binding protein [Chloroflexota bacterium]
MRKTADGHLKQACSLTGAAWAALVGAESGSPIVLAAHGLPALRARTLEKILAADPGAAWYKGLGSKRPAASLGAVGYPRLGVRRIWGYSMAGGDAIVVGADTQRGKVPRIWVLVAALIGRLAPVRSGMAASGLEAEAAYDSQKALDGILSRFIAAGEDYAGWLAIRRGEQLIIAARRNTALAGGLAFEVESSPLLSRICRTRSGLKVQRGSGDWDAVPHALTPESRFWAGLPLVVNERVIGAVAVWGSKVPSAPQMRALATRARQVSQQVDLIVSLGEVTGQLHRLATLNEFALAISSAEELPQMARRVLGHLGAIFPRHKIGLFVPTLHGGLMQEFSAEGANFVEHTAALAGHPMSRWFSGPADPPPAMPAGDSSEGKGRRLVLTVPLRYREATVGALTLHGDGAPELSQYDRSMLAVVASYMAGVVEHGRLRMEAEERARRLEETVQQLREAELAASARLAAQQAAESRLLQAAKLVAVGEMAAGVAHELNNPLTTVSGFAELILDETPAEAPYRADLERVLHEARRARSVVRRLLDFARQGEPLKMRADINEIVEDVLAMMTHFVHTGGVQLEVELAPSLPWITLDGNQIKQVLLNLFHNALHAMPGGGRLQVRTELRRRAERDWIVTHVADNGIGIDAAGLERIFEPFYTTRAESGGTGLGLSVTYGIVSDHGGTIDVQSQRGGGSTFSVWLPV